MRTQLHLRKYLAMRLFQYFPIALLLVALSTGASASITRLYEQKFPVAQTDVIRLKAELFSGSIDIQVDDVPEIRATIRAVYEVESEAEADRLHGDLRIGMQRNGNEIDVTADYGRDIHWTFENWPPVKLAVTIIVPRHSDLDLATRDGSVTVARMQGNMKARTRAGVIFFRGVEGSIQAESDYSDIIISHCTGDLKLRCVSGEFRVGPVGGSADVYGHGGEIEAAASCRGLKAETSGADLIVGFRHPLSTPATLRTGGGNIILTFDKRSAATLDLRASLFGKVTCIKDSLSLNATTGALGKSRLAATLNGGGAIIDARASGGSISVMADSSSD